MGDEVHENRLSSSPRVVVVAEDPLARGALSRSLGQEPDVVVVAQATGLAEVKVARAARQPHAIVWDVGLRAGDLRGLTEALALGLTMVVLVPDEAVGAAVLALGAPAVLTREASPSQVVASVRAAAEGLVVLSPELARTRLGTRPANDDEIEDLTPREKDVLTLLVEGLSNKLIAAKLGISEHTAKFHVNALLQKTRASTRTEVVVRAARAGLITL